MKLAPGRRFDPGFDLSDFKTHIVGITYLKDVSSDVFIECIGNLGGCCSRICRQFLFWTSHYLKDQETSLEN